MPQYSFPIAAIHGQRSIPIVGGGGRTDFRIFRPDGDSALKERIQLFRSDKKPRSSHLPRIARRAGGGEEDLHRAFTPRSA
jgi:hypothetical protein